MKISAIKLAKIKADYEAIVEALKRTDFHRGKAAKLLGVDPKTIYNKIKKYREIAGKENTLS